MLSVTFIVVLDVVRLDTVVSTSACTAADVVSVAVTSLAVTTSPESNAVASIVSVPSPAAPGLSMVNVTSVAESLFAAVTFTGEVALSFNVNCPCATLLANFPLVNVTFTVVLDVVRPVTVVSTFSCVAGAVVAGNSTSNTNVFPSATEATTPSFAVPASTVGVIAGESWN